MTDSIKRDLYYPIRCLVLSSLLLLHSSLFDHIIDISARSAPLDALRTVSQGYPPLV